MTDKLEFKVGDKVEVMREGMEMKIPVGRVAMVAKVDVHDQYYPYHVRYGTVLDWFTPDALKAYRNQADVVEEADSSSYGDIAVKQPIDLYTVEVILDFLKSKAQLAVEGNASHKDVTISTLAYLVGMKAALND